MTRRLANLFANRRISTKIAVGFACVLAITVAISAMSFVVFDKVGEGFESYQQQVRAVAIARDIDRAFVGFRRNAGEFIHTGRDSFINVAEQRRKTVVAEIARGLEKITNPESLGRLKELSQLFESYAQDFATAVALKQEQSKLTAETLDLNGIILFSAMERLQEKSKEAGAAAAAAGEAMKQLLIARLNVNKLLVRYEDGTAEAADVAFADLAKAIGAVEAGLSDQGSRKLVAEAKTGAATYKDAYRRVSAIADRLDKLVNSDMNPKAEAIANRALAIRDQGMADEDVIEKETEALITGTDHLILLFAGAGVAVGALLAWLIGRGISRPIRKIGEVLLELASGNKAVDVPYAERGDEVGENARAARTFKENLLRIEQMEAEQRAAEERAVAQRKADMHKLADGFEAAVGNIVEAVTSASTELEAAAGTLTQTADTTQRLSTTVASASEQASANVNSVASATDQMSSSVTEISRQVQESSRIANEAVKQAERTDARITELSQAAGRIGDVVKLITAIAEQTNLLALNATIEAARAGESGRGFAVVAQEVKALAAQTGKATGDIGAQIAGMQAATQDSVAAIKEIGGTIARIAGIASTIAAAVEEQGAATHEITRNVQQASQGTSEVAANITDVNRGAAETGSAAAQVLSSAQALSSESNHLKLEVDTFLATVRAA